MALCERFNFHTRIRAWPFGGQHQLTFASDEAERGDGLIYRDGCLAAAQFRLQARPMFQSDGVGDPSWIGWV